MITLKQYLEVVDYRVTEGSEFTWNCFKNAYNLSAWNGDHDGWSFNCVFDTKTQTVYMVEACDYKRKRAYRLINPEYQPAYHSYGKNKEYADQAWDDIQFVDLETNEDWLEKSRAIVEDRDYDTRVAIPLDLPNDVLFELMRHAHERDCTLNQLFEEIIRKEIQKAGVNS